MTIEHTTETTTQTSVERAEPRAMLAQIALADLPVPAAVNFHPGGEILTLTFQRIADGQVWSRHLGGKTDTYVYEGRVYLSEGVIGWRGWSVHLLASEDETRDVSLDDETTAQLTVLAGQ